MSDTLTKAHIVETVAGVNGYTRNKSFKIVEILLELIKSTLESGEDLMISGFGKFCVKQKAKRRGRNPATGKVPGSSTKKSRHIQMVWEIEGKTEHKTENKGKEKTR